MDSNTYANRLVENLTDCDPIEVPSEDARDFFVGTSPDGEPLVHAPQIALE